MVDTILDYFILFCIFTWLLGIEFAQEFAMVIYKMYRTAAFNNNKHVWRICRMYLFVEIWFFFAKILNVWTSIMEYAESNRICEIELYYISIFMYSIKRSNESYTVRHASENPDPKIFWTPTSKSIWSTRDPKFPENSGGLGCAL